MMFFGRRRKVEKEEEKKGEEVKAEEAKPAEESKAEEAKVEETPKDESKATEPEKPAEPPKPAEPDWKDQYARLLADFDNFKKRTARDREDTYRYAEAEILRDILPTVDNLALALGNAKDKESDFVPQYLETIPYSPQT